MAPTFCNRCGDALEEGCDLWDELAELDALLERLRLKRYDLKRKINRFYSPIVRQLPPDVMSTIFEFCLPNFPDHRDQLSITKKDLSFPLSLGAIFSYWREIAWSTPSLWSSLVVLVPTNSHVPAGIAKEWLARSGQLPLSIRIHAIPGYLPSVLALADIINQYCTRWSHLDLYMPPRYYRYFHSTAPILKSIRLHCSSHHYVMNFQLTCPHLERANLSSFPVDGTNIHWDNLTHLTLHHMSIIDSFLILRKTPRLVFCKFTGLPSLERYRQPSPLVLTSLRSLQLTTTFAENFLDNLIAPHLEEFALPRYYSASMDVITSFLRRSACSLRSFSMDFSISPPPPYFEDFMSLLQSIPSLNKLSIISVTTTSGSEIATPEDYDPRNILQLVAKILSSQSTSLQEGFLPNLKILEYTGKLRPRSGNYCDLYPLPPADNAVHGPLHLLKLNLFPATRLPESMISYLLSLVERGVTVNVLSESKDILQSSIDYYRWRKDSLCRDWSDNLDSSLFLDFCGVTSNQNVNVNTCYLDQPGCSDK